MSVMSHQGLVAVGAQWLAKKCAIVTTELTTTGETPDVLGWHGTFSTLIECKVSRSDFLADQHKPFRRQQDRGLGQHRYYLATPGIIFVDDLPANWGLLEWSGERMMTVKKAEHIPGTNYQQELRILLSIIRRIGHTRPTGVSIKVYHIASKNTATLGVEMEGVSQ